MHEPHLWTSLTEQMSALSTIPVPVISAADSAVGYRAMRAVHARSPWRMHWTPCATYGETPGLPIDRERPISHLSHGAPRVRGARTAPVASL